MRHQGDFKSLCLEIMHINAHRQRYRHIQNTQHTLLQSTHCRQAMKLQVSMDELRVELHE